MSMDTERTDSVHARSLARVRGARQVSLGQRCCSGASLSSPPALQASRCCDRRNRCAEDRNRMASQGGRSIACTKNPRGLPLVTLFWRASRAEAGGRRQDAGGMAALREPSPSQICAVSPPPSSARHTTSSFIPRLMKTTPRQILEAPPGLVRPASFVLHTRPRHHQGLR